MTIPGLSTLDMDDVERAITSVPEIEKVVVFGSRAKGTFRPGSDVDLALWGRSLDHDALLELGVRLNQEGFLPYHFDLVEYQTIENQALRDHIDRRGIVIFEK
jgi:predicted nucleotidyltransferase